VNVLVTGAGGFLGKRVVQALLERGHDVRAVVRRSSDPNVLSWSDRLVPFHADLRGGGSLVPAFEDIECVVHLATQMTGDDFAILSGTLTGTERLLAAMGQTEVKRLVLCSSFSVYDWSRVKGKHDETSPLPASVADGGAYAMAKRWQERLARRGAEQHGWKLTILRPGFIWGRGNDDLACVGQRAGRWQLVFGPSRRPPLTHVDNCAEAFALAAEHTGTTGETLDVVDDDLPTARAYARDWLDHHGGGRTVPIPYFLARGGVGLVNRVSRWVFGPGGKLPSMFVPVRFELRYKPLSFSNAKLRSVLGWRPRFDYRQALERTYGRPDPEIRSAAETPVLSLRP